MTTQAQRNAVQQAGMNRLRLRSPCRFMPVAPTVEI